MNNDPNELITCRRGDFQQMVDNASKVRKGLSGWQSKQPTGYFSTVRMDFARTGAGPYTYTLAPGDRVAFSYANEQQMQSAGYRAGVTATLRNTNLSDPGATRSGERYYVEGIALAPSPDSDIVLMTFVWSQAYSKLTMNAGADIWQLGPLFFFPAVAGIFGNGTSLGGYVTPPLSQAFTPYALPENSSNREGADGSPPSFIFDPPLVWNPKGSKDSDLKFPITIPSPGIVVTANDRAGAAGVAQFNAPLDNAVGTWVDITVRLVGQAESALSENK